LFHPPTHNVRPFLLLALTLLRFKSPLFLVFAALCVQLFGFLTFTHLCRSSVSSLTDEPVLFILLPTLSVQLLFVLPRAKFSGFLL
jgi:hypothetical protein